MDHLCYKCNASIDESLPFCPHCAAPQIRVVEPDEVPAADPTSNPPPPPAWYSAPSAYQPNAVRWDVAVKGAALAGLTAAILSSIPIVGFGCCLWLLGTGAGAVWLYQRAIPTAHLTPGMGMRIGAVSGLFGFLLNALWLTFQFTRDSAEFRTSLIEQMEKSIASNPNPQSQEVMRQLTNTLNTPGGLASLCVLTLVIMGVVFVVFSAAGGAFGASLFRRRNQR